MIGFRCVQQGNSINPYTVSIKNNGKIEPLKSSLAYIYRNIQDGFVLPVIIGNNVGNCAGMFYDCHYISQNISIPDSVIDCSHMFHGCGNIFWNGNEIKIPNNAKYLGYMFFNVYNFSQNIHIPPKVENVGCMLGGDDTLFSTHSYPNVYFEAKEYRDINIIGMFGNWYQGSSDGVNRSLIKNVFFNSVLNNVFNRNASNSIAGGTIEWTPMTNGFYNSEFNFYMYNNY